MWVLIGMACGECNTRMVQLFTDEPTEEQERQLSKEMGGMWCIDVRKRQAEVDGEAVDFDNSYD